MMKTLLGFVSVLSLSTLPAFAAINNCPVSTGTLSRTFTGGPTYSNVAVPGASATNNLASLGASGCTAIDLTFSNFALTSSGTNEGNLPFAAGTYASVTPTGTTQTGPDTILFSTLQGDGSGVPESGVAATLNDGTANTKVNQSQSFTTTMHYTASDSIGTGIFGILLTVNDITISIGGSGFVTIDTCFKGTGSNPTPGNITTQAQCNTAVGGTGIFQSATITLAQLAAQSASISFATRPLFVNVTQVISLTCATCGTSETGFLTFSDQFFETPEPSTFFLFSAALGLIALRRYRAVSR